MSRLVLVLLLGMLIGAPFAFEHLRRGFGATLVELNAPLPSATRFVLSLPVALPFVLSVLTVAAAVGHEVRCGSGLVTLAVNIAATVFVLVALAGTYTALLLPVFEIVRALAR